MVKVQVKWQGKKYDVDVDTSQPGELFKTQLFSLTGVPHERQKILVKGGQLKDDTDMAKLGLRENQVLMMMGTVGELPRAPPKPVKFVEDMSENEVAQALKIPAGLVNMGNTCYMNATLQVLKVIPELRKALDEYKGGMGQQDPQGNLTASLGSLFKFLSESADGVSPIVFLQFLRQVFPKFAERDPRFGGYQQQDAEECLNELITILDRKLKIDDDNSVIDKYVSGRMVTTIKSDEAPEETPTVREDRFNKIDCHIDKSVNYLSQGIAKGLEQKIEKMSETLGHNTEYDSVSRISRLPKYLTVAYNRFFWKASESVEAKIVKNVKFPLELDVSEFCTPELQEKMRPIKHYLRDLDDKKALNRKLAKRAKLDGDDSTLQDKAKEAEKSNEASASAGQDSASAAAAGASSIKMPEIHPDLKADEGCNPSGAYELVGVITHIGRTANSGHYIGWVRKEKGTDGPEPAGPNLPETQHWWYKFDDDEVSMVTDDDILKLSGGGDWHTAYVTLYRAKRLE